MKREDLNMRHTRRHLILLVGFGLPLLSLAGDADAQFASALRGDYDVILTRPCFSQAFETPSGSGTFYTSLVGPFLLRGTLHYDGVGAGSLIAQSMNAGTSYNPTIGTMTTGSGPAGSGVVSGAGEEFIFGQANFNCPSGTYVVNSDGTFTHYLNCTFNVLTGSSAGSIATWNGVALEGRLSLDGTVLVLGSTHSTNSMPNVETFTFTTLLVNGVSQTPPPPTKRICKGNGTATARR